MSAKGFNGEYIKYNKAVKKSTIQQHWQQGTDFQA